MIAMNPLMANALAASRRTWLAGLLIGLTPVAWAQSSRGRVPWPAGLQVTYDVSGQANGLRYRASSRVQWRHTATQYEANMEAQARWIGGRTQRSVGQWNAAGALQPAQFTDRARRERRHEMDWVQRQYRYWREGQLVHQGTLVVGAQDRLSLLFELARQVHHRADASVGARWAIPVIGGDASGPWQFEWTGQDTVETPAGVLPARRLQRTGPASESSTMQLWLYEPLGWLPARLWIQEADGDFIDQRLASWTPTA